MTFDPYDYTPTPRREQLELAFASAVRWLRRDDLPLDQRLRAIRTVCAVALSNDQA